MTDFASWLWDYTHEDDRASWWGHGYQGLAYTVLIGAIFAPWVGLLVAMGIFMHREAPTLIQALLSTVGILPRPAKGLDSAADYLTPVAGGLLGVAGLELLGGWTSIALTAGAGLVILAGFYALYVGDEL